MPKGPILKGPRVNKVKFAEAPTKVMLQQILDKCQSPMNIL